MHDWLAAQARARPDGLALVIGQAAWTYRALDREVARFVAQLAALGVRRGARVGILLPNRLEAVLAVHAAARLGYVLVMLNTRLTARELDHLLGMTLCDLLLCAKETAATALELRAPVPQFVCVDATGAPGLTPLNTVVPTSASDCISSQMQPDDPFAILFTSGTTGAPKGAVLTYNNIFYNALGSAYRIGVLPHDRWLCILPLYHVGGLSIIMRACLYGTAVDLWQHFDPAAINAALDRDPVTLISLVPTMLYRMLEERTNHPPALRMALLGGAAASPDLLASAHSLGIPVATTYGMTEATSQVATALPADVMRKPGSVGKPLLFTQVCVLDADGHDQPPGQYGEIVVSGPTVMQGYHNDIAATQRVLRDGWLATGDIGYLDDEGDLWVVQRRSDLIISGGENVYPSEVEQILRMHPAVAEVAVFGVDSPEWGQQVAAVIVLRDAATTVNEIMAFSRGHLAGYKQPRHIRFVAQIPRTASGKIHRAALAELKSEQFPRS